MNSDRLAELLTTAEFTFKNLPVPRMFTFPEFEPNFEAQTVIVNKLVVL